MKKRYIIAAAIVPTILFTFATIRDSCANPSYAEYFAEQCHKPQTNVLT
jgi:hypothetical protein